MLPTQKKQLELYLGKINKFHQNMIIFFAAGAVIILATLIFHSYPTYAKIQEHKEQIRITQQAITEQTQEQTLAQQELKDVEEKLEEVLDTLKPVLDEVLPFSAPIDDITLFLEDFALSLDTEKHPLKIETISFSLPTEDAEYSILPFRMSIKADERNFKKFLDRIETSGSLKKQDHYVFSGLSKITKAVPVMSIEEISVTLPRKDTTDLAERSIRGQSGEGETDVPLYTFNVKMNAYYDPTRE